MRLFVCGDTHMPVDVKKLSTKNWPESRELTQDDVLVQLGDFGGIWYPLNSNKEQDYWLEWLCNKNWTTAVVPGNHENYDVIDTFPWEEKWGDRVQVYEHDNGRKIYFLRKGGLYNINGRSILAIGGAKSIDKEWRVIGESWWEQEAISYKEIEDTFDSMDKSNRKVDYILTHTCPERILHHFIWPTVHTMGKFKCPVAQFLNEVDNQMEFKEWHFGHMHSPSIHEEDGVKYQCHYNNEPKELE